MNRFIVKHITKTEFQMFIDCAPAYFEYMNQVLFHGRVSVLVKVLGVHELQFQSGNGEMKRRQIIIMENLFQKCTIAKTFDLKGAHRQMPKGAEEDDGRVFLDDSLMEFTDGHPLPLREANKRPFQVSVVCASKSANVINVILMSSMLQDSYLNDTLFLSTINVVDYSILVGIDEENQRLVCRPEIFAVSIFY